MLTAKRKPEPVRCWGCGKAAPTANNGLRNAGWHSRPATAVAPGHGGFKPRAYRVTETVCPECFEAAGGWYDPPGGGS